MLSKDARTEWLVILAAGALLTAAAAVVHWVLALVVIAITAGLVAFFRDPDRSIPPQRYVMVAPADGKISSVHELEHYEPFNGPATCVRIFLSVLDVHINRSPCHGMVERITHLPGLKLNALNPQSAEDNESVLTVMIHPMRKHPVAAVRQVAGLLARTIHNSVEIGQVLQRGQRIGLIKLGSTTELYVPATLRPVVQVKQGDRVQAGMTVLVSYTPLEAGVSPEPGGSEAIAGKVQSSTTQVTAELSKTQRSIESLADTASEGESVAALHQATSAVPEASARS